MELALTSHGLIEPPVADPFEPTISALRQKIEDRKWGIARANSDIVAFEQAIGALSNQREQWIETHRMGPART